MNWFFYLVLMYPPLYILHAFLTFIFFLAIMRLQEMRDKGLITKEMKPFAYLILGIGYALDFTFNVSSSIPLLEAPKELLFSARVTRLAKESGWRSKFASWACTRFLNPGDPSGCHCK